MMTEDDCCRCTKKNREENDHSQSKLYLPSSDHMVHTGVPETTLDGSWGAHIRSTADNVCIRRRGIPALQKTAVIAAIPRCFSRLLRLRENLASGKDDEFNEVIQTRPTCVHMEILQYDFLRQRVLLPGRSLVGCCRFELFSEWQLWRVGRELVRSETCAQSSRWKETYIHITTFLPPLIGRTTKGSEVRVARYPQQLAADRRDPESLPSPK